MPFQYNKEIKYRQSSHIITIEKNSIHKKTFGSISREEIKVEVTPQKFVPYINIKESKNAFDFDVKWEGLKMEGPIESFTIKVKYKDNTIRHIVNVSLSYVKEDPLVTCELIPSNVPWGDDSACCYLCVRCGNKENPSWVYNKGEVSLNIGIISSDFYCKGPLPQLISVCNEINIPIFYRYKTPVDKIVTKELKVRVNGVEKSSPISFLLSSVNMDDLVPDLTFLKSKVYIGTGVIDIAVFSVSCKNSFKSLTGAEIELSCQLAGTLTKRKSGRNSWTFSLDTNKVKNLPVNPIGVTYSLTINGNKLYNETFYLFNNETGLDLKGVQLLLQNSIEIHPQIQNGTTFYYTVDRVIKLPFEVRNISGEKIDKVCLKIESEIFKNNLLFHNNKKELVILGLKPNKVYNFDVIIPNVKSLGGAKSITATICPNNDYQNNVAQQYTFNYILSPQFEPTIKVEGNLMNHSLFVDDTYENEPVCSIIIHNLIRNGIPNNGVADIVVSKLSLDNNKFHIQPIDGNIVCGDSREFVLYFSGRLQNDESHDDIIPVNFYYDDIFVSSMDVKFKKRVYSGPFPLSEPYSNDLKFIYPTPDESKIINILHCSFRDDEVPDLSSPKIIVNNPFCLNGMPDSHELELSDLPTFDISLNCEALGVDAVNIEKEIAIPYNIIFSNDIATNPHLETGEIALTPCNLSANKRVEFEDEFCNRYEHNFSKFIHKFSIAGADVLRMRLGAFVVHNLTKYEWKEERVSLPSCTVLIQELNDEGYSLDLQNNLSSSNDFFDISIPNGGAPQVIDVWLDIKEWQNCGCPKSLVLLLCREEGEELIEELCVGVELEEIIDDNIYSLDLGTTGIVMAKEQNGKISLLKLKDKENDAIENDPHILSSIVLLKKHQKVNAKQENNLDESTGYVDEFELAPYKSDYMGDKGYHVIVPSKFIIGQDKIPFENDINDGYINAFGYTIPYSKKEGRKSCKQIIGCLYKHIFKDKIENADRLHIKKLVVTYPNTYSQENIEGVKQILIEEVKLLPQNVSFIPESDAVAAYYFSYRIDHGDFFKNGEEKKETVVIYDMGAGTLDVSVVEFVSDDSGNITASIKKKIGIPIAGNYLDFMLYKQLQELNVLKDVKLEDKDLAEKLTKEFITKYKKTYPNIQETNQSISDTSEQGKIREADIKETYQDYIDFEELENKKEEIDLSAYINICSTVIFETLGVSRNNVERIVLSGRGSQFAPLKDAIKNYFGEEKIEIIPEYLDGDLKTCVAIGALKYLQYFDESINANYKIENRSQYQKIGVVYRRRIPGGLETACKILLDPDTIVWENAEKINGCRSREFHESKELEFFEGRSGAYYVQSLLDSEKIANLYTTNFTHGKDDGEQALLRSLVNELFYIPKLTLSNNHPVEAELSIDINNNITRRRIGNVDFVEIPIVETIENNELYRNSMWPFIK